MNKRVRNLLFIAAIGASQLGLIGEASARDFTCHATISMAGTSHSYTVTPWDASTPGLKSRHKKCRLDVIRNYLNNGEIWSILVKNGQITAKEATKHCNKGRTFRVDYGLSNRNKSWNFVRYGIRPRCQSKCTYTFTP